MGMKTREVGGGPATGLANDFVNWLQQGITTGSFGAGTAGQQFGAANPMGSTMGMSGILNDLLAGGAGVAGGSMGEMIRKDTERGALALRERFGSGAYGSPGAYAEALYRAEAAPRATQAISGMQMQMLSQMLPIFAGMAGRGISQRETIAQPSALTSTLGILAPLAGQIFAGMANPMGAVASAAGGAAANAFRPQPLSFNPPPMNWNLSGGGGTSTMFNPAMFQMPQFQMPTFQFGR